MARFEFRLPDIGEGIAEAEIVAWHVKPGDVIDEDAPVADMMTDKATVELSAPVGGTVVATNGAVGDNIPIGSVIAVFETGGDEPPAPQTAESSLVTDETAAPATPVQRDAGTRVLASPAVRQRARDLGIDLALVRPGNGDRIRHGDLDAYLRHVPMPAPGAGGVEFVKVTGLRRKIAEKMAESKRHIPHFSYVEEVDVTALETLRATMNAEDGERMRLTPLPFLILALVKALPEFPGINARYDDAEEVIERHQAVHLGIATQTGNGLVVPVLRDAGRHDVRALAAEVARLSDAARDGRLSREDLSGSTITLTSLGALGGIASTPIINRPEVAIVGVNRIVERAAVVDGRIEVRKMMNLSSSFDHRVVDGWDAARFIQAVKRLIEAPALLFAPGTDPGPVP